MKKALLALTLFLFSCKADPIKTEGTNNNEVPVSLLFEHEGYKVYRFRDGNSHYYVVPTGTVIETHTESNGKTTTTYTIETQTVTK